MRRAVLLVAVALSAVGGLCDVRPERKVYAHFMGCWPAQACLKEDLNSCDRDLKAFLRGGECRGCAEVGGRIQNKPLMPPECVDMPLKDVAKLEIGRAIRAGIDGFAFDAWAGDNSPNVLDVYFKAAEEMGVDFGLTVCFDPSCHGAKWIEGTNMCEKFVSSAKRVLGHVDSPNMARFHGKPLFFGYYSRGIALTKRRFNGFLSAEDRRMVKECWDAWRRALPCEVYLHGSIENYVDWRDFGNNDYDAIARDCAETFDTVGAFTGWDADWANRNDLWRHVKDAGCGWSQPLIPQYCNKRGGIITGAGLDVLHGCWTNALSRGSELLQFVTWNDYGEETILAPAYGSNYTFLRVNRHYADWLKAGAPPKIEKDEIHVVFRRCCDPKATSFPFHARRVDLPTALEVVTFLSRPGKVVVDGYGEYEAPAGMFSRKFAERPGRISARVLRRDEQARWRTVCGLAAPEEISARKWREDNMAATWSSTFEEEWEKDFPGRKPIYYSENGDVDGDGLPNWFEMVYFGKFPFMETAGCADPDADPDGDGLTNLREYKICTNPLVADTPYAADHVWSLGDLAAVEFAGNPTRDTKGRYVWRREYQYGAKGHDYVPGSAFAEIKSGGGSLQSQMVHVYERNELGGGGFDTGIQFNRPERGQAEARVHRDSPIALAWIAPGDCTVDVTTEVAPQNPNVKCRTTLVRGDQVLGEASAKGVKVARGEEIRLVIENLNKWSSGDMFTIKTFEVRRLATQVP